MALQKLAQVAQPGQSPPQGATQPGPSFHGGLQPSTASTWILASGLPEGKGLTAVPAASRLLALCYCSLGNQPTAPLHTCSPNRPSQTQLRGRRADPQPAGSSPPVLSQLINQTVSPAGSPGQPVNPTFFCLRNQRAQYFVFSPQPSTSVAAANDTGAS